MPNFCSNGCPFYGTPQTNNLCSACFRLAQAASQSSSTSGSTAAMTATVPPPPMHPAPVLSPPPSVQSASVSVPVMPLDAPVSTPSLTLPSSEAPTVMVTASPKTSASADAAPPDCGPKPDADAAAQPPASAEAADAPPPRKRPNRCTVCRKKLGLTPFVCRCNQLFCATHLPGEAHDCTFDYKAHHREALARANPTVIAKKVDKI